MGANEEPPGGTLELGSSVLVPVQPDDSANERLVRSEANLRGTSPTLSTCAPDPPHPSITSTIRSSDKGWPTAYNSAPRTVEGNLCSGPRNESVPDEYSTYREGAMFPEEPTLSRSFRARNDLDSESTEDEFLRQDQRADQDFRLPNAAGIRWKDFEEFYDSAYPRLLRLSVALVWSKAVAEDHVQDAFAKTYARFATLDEPEAYVRKTLVNEVRISFRRKQMMQRFAPLLRSTLTHSDSHTDDSLLKALDSLPLRQRTAVILRYYEQCTEQEIAHALNCRPGTVKSLLSRGLASLRKVVDHE
jgi:RNA polymerase sigma factor (sigma-70 family)